MRRGPACYILSISIDAKFKKALDDTFHGQIQTQHQAKSLQTLTESRKLGYRETLQFPYMGKGNSVAASKDPGPTTNILVLREKDRVRPRLSLRPALKKVLCGEHSAAEASRHSSHTPYSKP